MKKTNLATKTGLNYNVCLRYIKMLKVLEWIDVSSDKWDYVSITEVGRQVNDKLLNPATVNAAVVSPDSANRLKEEFQHQLKQPPSNIPTPEKIMAGMQDRTHHSIHELRNIMIVDDEPDILVTYQSFLSLEGYRVAAFSDAYSALREFAAKPSLYDLVILDIRMSELNGLQMYQSLRAMNPYCKIIFITALDAAKEMVSILPGVTSDNIIKKPIDKDLFLRKINDVFA